MLPPLVVDKAANKSAAKKRIKGGGGAIGEKEVGIRGKGGGPVAGEEKRRSVRKTVRRGKKKKRGKKREYRQEVCRRKGGRERGRQNKKNREEGREKRRYGKGRRAGKERQGEQGIGRAEAGREQEARREKRRRGRNKEKKLQNVSPGPGAQKTLSAKTESANHIRKIKNKGRVQGNGAPCRRVWSEKRFRKVKSRRKTVRKFSKRCNTTPGNRAGHMTTMSMALNCSFSDSGKPSSVIRTLMSSARAKV